MKKFCLLLLMFCYHMMSYAQLVKTFSINFESNQYHLNTNQLKQLDSIISTLPNIPQAYYVKVTGHTDNKGSLALNTQLSKNRANSVFQYLTRKQFKVVDSSLTYYAYSQPLVENTDESLWRNRRVEVNVFIRPLNMVKILGIKDFSPKKYKFIEDNGGTITYDSTNITIAPNSFVHQNGTEVTGDIEISYQEFRNPADFILSGIPMSIKLNNTVNHFNSAGMFNIKAYQNNEELVLKTAKDKQINLDFPLSNFINQQFFNFDSTKNQWNSQAPNITNVHGNLLMPFNGSSSFAVASSFVRDYTNFRNCVYGDTCEYINGMVKKIRYFLNHEEPIRLNYPFKFVKNYLIDFKSPYYKLSIDTSLKTVEFISQNTHNKFGNFSNYVWTFNKNEFNKGVKNQYQQGCSYVKIIYRGKNKFDIEIENQIYHVTGEPKNNSYSDGKTKRLHKKNYKSYLKYTNDLDNKEKILENDLRDLVNKPDENISKYGEDTLSCMDYFYRSFLYTSDEKVLLNIGDFNLHRDLLAKKIAVFSSNFNCDEYKAQLIRKDSLERAIVARRDSAENLRKNAFAKFGISETGVYNADQVKQISEPEEILASYINENNKPLKIIAIFISLRSINGIIRYDGFMDYGPYKFVYGKSDNPVLIAVDENEKSYYCSADEFKKYVNEKNNQKVIFKVHPIQNLKTTNELGKIVSN